jgi:hypothetical protein
MTSLQYRTSVVMCRACNNLGRYRAGDSYQFCSCPHGEKRIRDMAQPPSERRAPSIVDAHTVKVCCIVALAYVAATSAIHLAIAWWLP